MKQILQIILNIILLFYYFITSIILLFWYGKLVKVSPYHTYSNDSKSPSSLKDYMDKYFQSDSMVSDSKKKEIILEWVVKFGNSYNYKEYLEGLEVSIYDKGEKIGEQTVYSVLIQELHK